MDVNTTNPFNYNFRYWTGSKYNRGFYYYSNTGAASRTVRYPSNISYKITYQSASKQVTAYQNTVSVNNILSSVATFVPPKALQIPSSDAPKALIYMDFIYNHRGSDRNFITANQQLDLVIVAYPMFVLFIDVLFDVRNDSPGSVDTSGANIVITVDAQNYSCQFAVRQLYNRAVFSASGFSRY